MKLIYIANARIPTEKAHGFQICKMCEKFADGCEKVELWIPERTNKIKADAFEFYGLSRNFEIVRFRSFYFRDIVANRLGFYLQSILFLFKIFFKKRDKEMIIYTRYPEIAFLFSRTRNKTVYELHFWPENKGKFFKSLLRRIDKIIVISKSLQDKCLEAGVDRNKIFFAPDGVDVEEFDIDIAKEEARKKLDLPPQKKIAVYTGHLYKWKGADKLMEAVKYLSDDYLVCLVGGMQHEVEKYRNSIVDNNKIRLIGHRPHKEIPLWLKAADVLVLPNSAEENISKYYTSPLKMFEYMASKRPIIASALPSIKEILNDTNSFLVEPSEPKKLAAAIEKLSNDQNFSAKISQQAFFDVANYTWEKRAKKIIEFINRES